MRVSKWAYVRGKERCIQVVWREDVYRLYGLCVCAIVMLVWVCVRWCVSVVCMLSTITLWVVFLLYIVVRYGVLCVEVCCCGKRDEVL